MSRRATQDRRRAAGLRGRNAAVVIGASVAGLSTAAVLASRFGEVVLVDRDVLGDEPRDRRGVPQGRHAHVLLPAGHPLSSATLQAETLGEVLDEVPTLDDGFVRAFYRRSAKAINPIWQMSTGADFALPQTTGPKAPGTDAINRYMAKVLRASQVSEEVCRRFLEVTCVLRPPRDLLTPAMIAKVRRAARQVPLAEPAAEREDNRQLARVA